MTRLVALFIAAALLARPASALAQSEDDAPSWNDDAYDTSAAHASRPRKRPRTTTAEEELRDEPSADAQRMARADDPRTGFSTEAILALALLDKSWGPGPVGLASVGLRGSYAPGRLWSDPGDDFWRKALLIELTYLYTGQSDGTQKVSTSTSYHYVSLQGTLGYPVRDVLLLYGTAGPAMTIESVTYSIDGTSTPAAGIKPGLAYGAGGRLVLPLSDVFSFAGRLELLRFRRGYMDDTFVNLGLGLSF